MKLETCLKLSDGSMIDLLDISKIQKDFDIYRENIVIHNGKTYSSSPQMNVLGRIFWYPYEREKYTYGEDEVDVSENINKNIHDYKLRTLSTYTLFLKVFTQYDVCLGQDRIDSYTIDSCLNNEEEMKMVNERIVAIAEAKCVEVFEMKQDKIKTLLNEGEDFFNLKK